MTSVISCGVKASARPNAEAAETSVQERVVSESVEVVGGYLLGAKPLFPQRFHPLAPLGRRQVHEVPRRFARRGATNVARQAAARRSREERDSSRQTTGGDRDEGVEPVHHAAGHDPAAAGPCP